LFRPIGLAENTTKVKRETSSFAQINLTEKENIFVVVAKHIWDEMGLPIFLRKGTFC